MTPWIGYVRLHALTPAARFWGAKTDKVMGRLVLCADTADGYRAALKAALDPRGIALEAVEALAPITDTCSPELVSISKDADGETPLLFGRLCDADTTYPSEVDEVGAYTLQPHRSLWALLDGVAWPGLPQTLATSGDAHACLYASTDAGTLATGPWLVHLRPGSTMLDAILDQSPEAHVGIFLRSAATMDVLKRHLRRFTMAYIPGEAQAPVYFRFYDPRVMLDMASALSPATLGRFMEPMDEVYAPLSPRTVLPDHAYMALPITPFDSAASCVGRLARVRLLSDEGAQTRGAFRIDTVEYDRFQRLQRKKAERSLARKLSDEFPNRDWSEYRKAAQAAPVAAHRFHLKSVKQVSIMARAIMMRGQDFWDTYPEAGAILNQSRVEPWQKKNALVDWLVASARTQEPAT
ncbi:DUF4123 domain-containing protein [uncultured Tateyamaria sp.]|uniref:DUF4123 domain-containing protein n=1 Tax=Tateyamaria sp. 1078 TaxID=3417464 RepID=UPI00261F91C5|nr:DUF4123 domain-containing protein [uncultured Tateyamaria sp.]